MLSREQLWQEHQLAPLINHTKHHNNYIPLPNQMRVNPTEQTLTSIPTLIHNPIIKNLPPHKKPYHIKLFHNPPQLHHQINKKPKHIHSPLSPLLPTFHSP
ncbi:DNA/RNA helicase domain-containing protein, partial [Staphylococcus pettenkoferi]|uniref:DNA/RNA helicase domain-containing protein n=1 Tax=Staphylococcus pettenkoferi TaxID=170573 RepID=UPI003B8A802B